MYIYIYTYIIIYIQKIHVKYVYNVKTFIHISCITSINPGAPRPGEPSKAATEEKSRKCSRPPKAAYRSGQRPNRMENHRKAIEKA